MTRTNRQTNQSQGILHAGAVGFSQAYRIGRLGLSLYREVWTPGTLLNGFVLTSFGQVGFVISGYLIHICLAHLLGPEDYGLYGVVISIVVWIETCLTVGLLTTAYKGISERPQSVVSIAWHYGRDVTFFAVILLGVVFLMAKLVATTLGDMRITWLLPIASVDLLFFGLYRLSLTVQSGLRQFHHHAAIHLTYSAAKVAAIIIPVWLGFSVLGGLIGNIIASVVAMAVGLSYLNRLRYVNTSQTNMVAGLRDNLGMVVAVSISSLGHILFISADLWIIKAYTSATLTGQYLAALTVARLFLMVTLPLRNILMPFIAGPMQSGNTTAVRHALRHVLLLFFLVVFPALGIVIITANPIMDYFFSAAYVPGAPFLRVLAVGYVFASLAQIFSTFLLSLGRAWLACGLEIGCGLISLPLYFWSIQTFGPTGVPYVLAVMSFGTAICGATIVRQVIISRVGRWHEETVQASGSEAVHRISNAPAKQILHET